MKYILEYHEHDLTEAIMEKMRVHNQNIVSITTASVYGEFIAYVLTIRTNSQDDKEAYLLSIGAIFDKFDNKWKVGD